MHIPVVRRGVEGVECVATRVALELSLVLEGGLDNLPVVVFVLHRGENFARAPST